MWRFILWWGVVFWVMYGALLASDWWVLPTVILSFCCGLMVPNALEDEA